MPSKQEVVLQKYKNTPGDKIMGNGPKGGRYVHPRLFLPNKDSIIYCAAFFAERPALRARNINTRPFRLGFVRAVRLMSMWETRVESGGLACTSYLHLELPKAVIKGHTFGHTGEK